MIVEDRLIIGGRELPSRFLLGTGKFARKETMREATIGSGAGVVTVALRRIDLERNEENILSYLPEGITLMVNTSGARNAIDVTKSVMS